MADLYSTLEEFLKQSQGGGRLNEASGPTPEEQARNILANQQQARPDATVAIPGGQLAPDMAMRQALFERRDQQANAAKPAPRPMDPGVANMMPMGPVRAMPLDQAAAVDNHLNQRRQVLEGLNPAQRQSMQRAEYLGPLMPHASEDLGNKFLKDIGINPLKQQAVDVRSAAVAGKKSGAGGIPADLLRSVGDADFEDKLTKAIDAGLVTNPTVQLRLEAQHNNAVRAGRVDRPDGRILSGLKSATGGLQDLKSAYEETPAFKTGRVSDVMRSALVTNSKAAAFEAMSPLPVTGKGFSEADRIFASKYNAVRASLREFSSDTRFSDSDKADVLRGIGSPATGPQQFPKQIDAMIDKLTLRSTNILDNLDATGRDTTKLRSLPSGNKGAAPAVGAVVGGYRFKGGDPSKRESWEK